MKFPEFLDSIENTEQEQAFRDVLISMEEDVAPAMNIPFVGDIFRALEAFCECESVEAFRLTPHYDTLKKWDIAVHDLEKGMFSIYPGAEMRNKIFAVVGVVFAVILGLWLWRKCCKKRR